MSESHHASEGPSPQPFSGALTSASVSASLSSSGFEQFATLGDANFLQFDNVHWLPSTSDAELQHLHGPHHPTAIENGHAPFATRHDTGLSEVGEVPLSHLYLYEHSRSLSSPQGQFISDLPPNEQANRSSPFPMDPGASSHNTEASSSAVVSPNFAYGSYQPAYQDPPATYPETSSSQSPYQDEESPETVPNEEKRKRNQAASARFRQKKKVREQQLERQTRTLTERTSELEGKITKLETENKFLKGLLTEKMANTRLQENKQGS